MKKFRKIMAVLVAAMMIMATMVPAWADTVAKPVTIKFDLNTGTGTAPADVTNFSIPANSDYAWYELNQTLTTYSPPAGSEEGTVFLGWGDTASSTAPLDRLLVTRADGDSVTVYAIYGKKTSTVDSSTDLTFGTDGKIVINNCAPGETYTAYQLFKLYSWVDSDILPDQHEADKEAYSYYIVKGNGTTENPLYDYLKNYTFTYEEDSDNDGMDETHIEYAFEFYDGAEHTVAANPAVTGYSGTYDNFSITKAVTVSGTDENWKFTPVRVNPKFMTMDGNNTADEATKAEYQVSAAVIQKFAQDVMSTLKTTIINDTTAGDANANTRLEKYAKVVAKKAVENPSADPLVKVDSIEITGLEYGYYLVDSTLGSLCALDSTNKIAYAIEKNEFTQVEKKVKENLQTFSGDRNDANLGEDVNFTSTVTIPLRQSNVVYHDKMSGCFTFTPADITISGWSGDYTIYYSAAGNNGKTGDDKIEWSKFPAPADDNYLSDYATDTFAIAFRNDGANGTEALTADVTVTITYKATLNNTALIGAQPSDTYPKGDGNDNISWVTYGDKQRSQDDWTRTYTWSFDIFKYAKLDSPTYAAKETTTGTGQQAVTTQTYADSLAAAKEQFVANEGGPDAQYWEKVNPLAGATFNVIRDSASTTALTFKLVGSYPDDTTTPAIYELSTAEGSTANIVTPKSGLITIRGLDADEYTVKETKAPVGYAMLNGNLDLHIVSTTSTQFDNNAGQIIPNRTLTKDGTSIDLISVQNITSKEMPSTGGMGTTVLYIVGGMLVILAGAYLFFSRKRTA